MKKSKPEKRTFDDSAQENMEITIQKKEFRKKLLDSIFNSGVFHYASLVKDEPTKNLFCGQVGEIEGGIVDENKQKDSYFLKFVDFENNEDEITRCLVKKENLLPLFSFDPTRDDKIEVRFKDQLGEQTWTIKKTREVWEECEVHEISTEKLKPHTKSETRFEIGQLVTIQVDFEQKLSNNEAFTIQAGQTGIISASIDENTVEVTFWSMPFGTLAVERKELVSKSSNQNPLSVTGSSDSDSLVDSIDVDSLTDSSWKKTIRIHKDYIFPLYIEVLHDIS